MFCVIAIYGEQMKHGPFAKAHSLLPVSNDVSLQIFLGFQALALFPASILFRQREQLQSQLRETNLQLETLASLDGLTAIPNRRTFDERFAMEWQRAGRQRGSLALLMIDIDHFKQFNDLYGHLAGDDCLRSVATSLARVLQRPEDLVARFGGEEFALLLPHTSHNGTRAIAEVLRNAVLDLEITHRGSPWNRVTVSIGFATVTPAPGELPAGLVHRADAALYRAKHLGRNRAETPSANEGDLQAA
jgi:two-component system chemotaxis family response regulator WspR